LHKACFALNLTNLDFVELLLKSGTDAANTQDHAEGRTLLSYTTQFAPGAANFLLSSPQPRTSILPINLDIPSYSGFARLFPDYSDQIRETFLLKQWRDIEEILVERGAIDTEITALSLDTLMHHPFSALANTLAYENSCCYCK
jgi:hypothetical protein